MDKKTKLILDAIQQFNAHEYRRKAWQELLDAGRVTVYDLRDHSGLSISAVYYALRPKPVRKKKKK